MSYTPPNGGSVGFTTTGISYTPPAGDDVVFGPPDVYVYVDETYSLTGSATALSGVSIQSAIGRIDLACAAELHTDLALMVRDTVQFSGAASLEFPFSISAYAVFALGGAAQFTIQAGFTVAATVRLSAVAVFAVPNIIEASGAYHLSGTASLSVSSVSEINVAGIVLLGGAASLLSSAAMLCAGKVQAYGVAQVRHGTTISPVVARISLLAAASIRVGTRLAVSGGVNSISGAASFSTGYSVDADGSFSLLGSARIDYFRDASVSIFGQVDIRCAASLEYFPHYDRLYDVDTVFVKTVPQSVVCYAVH